MTKPALKPGMKVTDTLELVEKLGEGGMGSVWVADHQALAVQVAVKFIHPERDSNAMVLERFAREAKLGAQIKNPHVVQVFDYGIADTGAAYIVMELLEGQSLEERLEHRGPLSPAETGVILAQTGRVLALAHELGIIHRDLKPANLFLNDVGYDVFVKVLDFGIAKRIDATAPNLTASTAVLGTPLYMSPEALKGRAAADEQVDLWALATVAYEALTGERPFDGATFADQTLLVHGGEFAPPSACGVPASFDAFFARAFARETSARYGSAEELVAVYQAALVKAQHATTVTRRQRPVPAAQPKTTLDGASVASDDPSLPLQGSPRRALASTLIGLGALAFLFVQAAGPSPGAPVSSKAGAAATGVAMAALAEHRPAVSPEAEAPQPPEVEVEIEEPTEVKATPPRARPLPAKVPPAEPPPAPLEAPTPPEIEYW